MKILILYGRIDELRKELCLQEPEQRKSHFNWQYGQSFENRSIRQNKIQINGYMGLEWKVIRKGMSLGNEIFLNYIIVNVSKLCEYMKASELLVYV